VSRDIDTSLARRLQKRGTWNSYSSALAAVRKVLVETEHTKREIEEMIDRGELDPAVTK
jgi:hypothetical protein